MNKLIERGVWLERLTGTGLSAYFRHEAWVAMQPGGRLHSGSTDVIRLIN